jgi:hypothetical protein
VGRTRIHRPHLTATVYARRTGRLRGSLTDGTETTGRRRPNGSDSRKRPRADFALALRKALVAAGALVAEVGQVGISGVSSRCCWPWSSTIVNSSNGRFSARPELHREHAQRHHPEPLAVRSRSIA